MTRIARRVFLCDVCGDEFALLGPTPEFEVEKGMPGMAAVWAESGGLCDEHWGAHYEQRNHPSRMFWQRKKD